MVIDSFGGRKQRSHRCDEEEGACLPTRVRWKTCEASFPSSFPPIHPSLTMYIPARPFDSVRRGSFFSSLHDDEAYEASPSSALSPSINPLPFHVDWSPPAWGAGQRLVRVGSFAQKLAHSNG